MKCRIIRKMLGVLEVVENMEAVRLWLQRVNAHAWGRIQRIRIRNPYQYAGGIVADLNNSTMRDCVVRELKVEAEEKTSSLRLGGIMGSNSASIVENCYAAGLNLDVSNAQANVVGVGGICGEASYSSSLSKTYAQGRIYTTSGEAGGITGLTNGKLNRGWAKVDISGSAVAGGIVGRVNSSSRVSQLLSVGNVSGKADSVGRIAGAITSDGTSFTTSYAYSGQQINSKILEDEMDANALITGEELKLEANYWYYLNLGYCFNYSGVTSGYLPKLMNFAEDKLLPGQDDLDIAFALPGSVDFVVEEGATADYDETKKAYKLDFTLDLKTPGLSQEAQKAESEAFYKTLKTALSGIAVPGMELNLVPAGAEADPSLCWSENKERFTWGDDGETLKLHMTDNVRIITYRDTYQATYGYTDNSGTLWELGDELDFGSPLFIHITAVVNKDAAGGADLVGSEADLSTWYGAMKQEGKNYQNFLIETDLDFSILGTITDPDLINLNINRLEGAGFAEKEKDILSKLDKESVRKDYLLYQEAEGQKTDVPMKTLSNISIQATAASQSMIRVLQGTMQGICIAKFDWNNGSYDGSYVGIIGRNTGNIRFVDFDTNTIYAGKASDRVGCIADNRGSMEYVRAKDSRIYNAPVTYLSRAGGLIGYNMSGITHCSAVGTKTDAGDYNFNVSITTSKNSNSIYTGGLVGYSENYVTLCYVDQIRVSGCQQTGALGGNINQRYGQYEDYMVDKSWQDTDLFYYCWVTNSSVSGMYQNGGVYGVVYGTRRNYSKGNIVTQTDPASYYAGGVTGQLGGWAAQYDYVEDCTVTTEGKGAGGVSGYGDNCNYETVVNCKIQAKQNAGGVSGAIPDYYIRYSKVEGSTITATDSYAGGVFGLVTGGKHYRHESGATVSASRQNAGGFAGELLGYCQKFTSQASATAETVAELAYPQTKVYSSIISGKISGGYNVGGFVGIFDKGLRPIDPENGKELDDRDTGYTPYLSQNYYYKLVLAPVSLNCASGPTLKLTYNNVAEITDTGNDEGIGYLRVYEGIESEKTTIATQLGQIIPKVEADNKKTLTEEKAKETAKVSDEVLASGWFYYNKVTQNGLYLHDGSGNDRIFDTRVCQKEGTTVTFPWLRSNS